MSPPATTSPTARFTSPPAAMFRFPCAAVSPPDTSTSPFAFISRSPNATMLPFPPLLMASAERTALPPARISALFESPPFASMFKSRPAASCPLSISMPPLTEISTVPYERSRPFSRLASDPAWIWSPICGSASFSFVPARTTPWLRNSLPASNAACLPDWITASLVKLPPLVNRMSPPAAASPPSKSESSMMSMSRFPLETIFPFSRFFNECAEMAAFPPDRI